MFPMSPGVPGEVNLIANYNILPESLKQIGLIMK